MQSKSRSSGFSWLVCHLPHAGEIICNFSHQLRVLLFYRVEELIQMLALNHVNGKSLESERSHLSAALMLSQML